MEHTEYTVSLVNECSSEARLSMLVLTDTTKLNYAHRELRNDLSDFELCKVQCLFLSPNISIWVRTYYIVYGFGLVISLQNMRFAARVYDCVSTLSMILT